MTNGYGIPVAEQRLLFLAPHYDDVALSCGGTVAAFAKNRARPLILTIFGGVPEGSLTPFAEQMHRQWRVSPEDAIATRRQEERHAAERLGADSYWLTFKDAIYRDDYYTSDETLFGMIHQDEHNLTGEIESAIHSFVRDEGIAVQTCYVPLAVGDHVDHQHVLGAALRLSESGWTVIGYEDFPYAGEPAGETSLRERAMSAGAREPDIRFLTPSQLQARIDAILCYASQLGVIFRHQGDPATATRRYAERVGGGRPAERFWPFVAR